MKRYRSLAALAVSSIAVLSGCSVTGPVNAVTTTGEQWIGTFYADTSTGIFEMSNAGTKCDGTYNQLSTERKLDLTFECSDGRIGSAVVNRTPDLQGGTGDFQMSDGTSGKFTFGGA